MICFYFFFIRDCQMITRNLELKIMSFLNFNSVAVQLIMKILFKSTNNYTYRLEWITDWIAKQVIVTKKLMFVGIERRFWKITIAIAVFMIVVFVYYYDPSLYQDLLIGTFQLHTLPVYLLFEIETFYMNLRHRNRNNTN